MQYVSDIITVGHYTINKSWKESSTILAKFGPFENFHSHRSFLPKLMLMDVI